MISNGPELIPQNALLSMLYMSVAELEFYSDKFKEETKKRRAC